MAEQPILELKDVYSSYGNIKALKGVLPQGIPGRNRGHHRCQRGRQIHDLDDHLLCGPHRQRRNLVQWQADSWDTGRGITQTGPLPGPGRQTHLSAPECGRKPDPGAFFRNDQEGIEADRQRAYELFPILKDRHKQHGGTLSGGEQQMLAIARALMGRPKVLLLDEPSLGLAPLIVKQIFDIIKDVNKTEGTTILLVEQNANLALQAASRGYVLETGTITLEDDAKKLMDNPEIRKAYLGE